MFQGRTCFLSMPAFRRSEYACDECLAVFYRPTMLDQLRNMLCGQVTIQPPRLRCAGNRLVFVEKAPEPADIFWEHLELSRGEKVGRDLARGRG